MSNTVEIMAAAVERKPHSFHYIRRATGLTVSDEEFTALVESDRGRFKLVHFRKQDDKGQRIHPGRPGVRLRANSV
jgi:hypothetical protein